MSTKTIAAGAFKQGCLRILDEVADSHQEVVITKRGKPVAKLVPVESESADLIGSLAGKIRVHGDILTTGLRWDAERDAEP